MESNLKSDEFIEHAMGAWKDTVYRLALNQTSSQYDADDICQDVFLSLLKDKTLFEDDEHLKAWLLCVTVNKCNDHQRSKWARHESPDENPLSTFVDQESGVTALLSSDIGKAMQKLPDKLRLIMYLHYVEGYATEEIARFVRCRPSTVRTRLHRARKQLKQLLGKEVDHERSEYAKLPYVNGRCEDS